jgi:succinate dehydrogenase flavin-adding protein (antitoxin of CptAB toxin-antitoxin module)
LLIAFFSGAIFSSGFFIIFVDMLKEDINVKNYLYNPFDKTSHDQLRQYEEFAELDEKAIIYIILSYDKNSDVRKEYASRAQQKVESAKLAGYKFTSNQFNDDVEEILVGENPTINMAIVRYLYLFGIPELMALDFYVQKMQQVLNDQRKGNDEKNSHVVVNFCLGQINDLTSKIFHGQEAIDLRKALYEFSENTKKMRYSPEGMAEKLENDEDPFNGYTPYGDNYVIEKPKYIGSK